MFFVRFITSGIATFLQLLPMGNLPAVFKPNGISVTIRNSPPPACLMHFPERKHTIIAISKKTTYLLVTSAPVDNQMFA
jgi:hypothetical protein